MQSTYICDRPSPKCQETQSPGKCSSASFQCSSAISFPETPQTRKFHSSSPTSKVLPQAHRDPLHTALNGDLPLPKGYPRGSRTEHANPGYPEEKRTPEVPFTFLAWAFSTAGTLPGQGCLLPAALVLRGTGILFVFSPPKQS